MSRFGVVSVPLISFQVWKGVVVVLLVIEMVIETERKYACLTMGSTDERKVRTTTDIELD